MFQRGHYNPRIIGYKHYFRFIFTILLTASISLDVAAFAISLLVDCY